MDIIIVAAMDVSGDPSIGNHGFIGIVIGTKESIDSMAKHLGSNKIHMSEIKHKKDRDSIISQLKFDNRNNIALCVKLNRDVVISRIRKMKRIRQQNIPNKKILRAYNKFVLYHLREKITNFLTKYGYTLSDIVFECDMDCRTLLKDNGLGYTDKNTAHMLSDIIAWANNNNKEPKGVISIDLTEIIEIELKKAFR